jgi:hypothetical protein
MNRLTILVHWIRTASPPRDIALTAASVLLGWALAHVYYVRALTDMQADAKERQRVEDLLLRGVESVGTVHYIRDTAGKVTGIKVQLHGTASAGVTTTGSLSVTSARTP